MFSDKFNDKDSMIDMFEESRTKKQWKHILLTSEIYGNQDILTTKELIAMHKEWRDSLKSFLHVDDAAYQINQGNIFILIHDSRLENFAKSVENLRMISKNTNGGIVSSVMFLTNEESEFLLKMS